jgi:hypothetical protein
MYQGFIYLESMKHTRKRSEFYSYESGCEIVFQYCLLKSRSDILHIPLTINSAVSIIRYRARFTDGGCVELLVVLLRGHLSVDAVTISRSRCKGMSVI